MSAQKTFPNFNVETCKNLSMHTIDSSFEFGNSAEKYPTETSRQGDVMRPKEITFLKVRDSVTVVFVCSPCRCIKRVYPHLRLVSTQQTCNVCLKAVYLCYCSLPYRFHSCHWFRNPGPANPPARLCHPASELVLEAIYVGLGRNHLTCRQDFFFMVSLINLD